MRVLLLSATGLYVPDESNHRGASREFEYDIQHDSSPRSSASTGYFSITGPASDVARHQ